MGKERRVKRTRNSSHGVSQRSAEHVRTKGRQRQQAAEYYFVPKHHGGAKHNRATVGQRKSPGVLNHFYLKAREPRAFGHKKPRRSGKRCRLNKTYQNLR